MTNQTDTSPQKPTTVASAPSPAQKGSTPPAPREIGGPKEADPTRYGDWTVKGRAIDF